MAPQGLGAKDITNLKTRTDPQFHLLPPGDCLPFTFRDALESHVEVPRLFKRGVPPSSLDPSLNCKIAVRSLDKHEPGTST